MFFPSFSCALESIQLPFLETTFAIFFKNKKTKNSNHKLFSFIVKYRKEIKSNVRSTWICAQQANLDKFEILCAPYNQKLYLISVSFILFWSSLQPHFSYLLHLYAWMYTIHAIQSLKIFDNIFDWGNYFKLEALLVILLEGIG